MEFLWNIYQDIISLSISPKVRIKNSFIPNKIIQQYHSSPYPISNITHWLLNEMNESIVKLEDLMMIDKSNHPSFYLESISTFTIEIFKASIFGKLYVGNKEETPILLIGDSAVSSHYRLGIGVNHALSIPFNLVNEMIVGDISFGECMSKLSNSYDWKVKYQLFTILFEAYCNLIVSEDLLFQRDYQNGEFYERIENLDEIWNLTCS